MQALFLELVKLSLTGSMFAAAVMLVRLVFRKAPKWLFCALWGVVALRLICPVSIESDFSLVPDRLASGQIITNVGSSYIGEVDILYENNSGYSDAVEAGRQPICSNGGYYVVTEKDSLKEPKTVGQTVYPVLSRIWVAGVALMLSYTAVSYLLLRKKMEEATLLRDNIWQCEQADSPFVLGFVKPRIYLPYAIADADMANVIAHENAHIQRKDHWWKPIGFMLLSVHWFNPVLWISYILLCRDIEAACDEKVIKHMEKDEMRAYSSALLNCSVHRRRIAACPLAFGEVGVKERIKRVMNYQKPAFRIILLMLPVCVAVAACFLTNPVDRVVNPWVQEYLSDTENGVDKEEFESLSGDFAIGADQYGYPVFKDPYKAFDTFVEHYAEGIGMIRQAFDLDPISRKNYDAYKVYGWQITTGSEEVRDQAAFVSRFLDIYENSFTEVPPITATDYISGKQATFLHFGYSRGGEIACGIAPWQGNYGEDNTLVLDGKYGPRELLLAPDIFAIRQCNVYLPDGTLCHDGTMPTDDSPSLMFTGGNMGFGLRVPFQTGEYIYEIELKWPEQDLVVTYGLKVVLTGEESNYDRAVKNVYAQYGEGNPLISISLVDKYAIGNAVSRSPRYLFKVEIFPNEPIYVEVSQNTGEIIAQVEPQYYPVDPPGSVGQEHLFVNSGGTRQMTLADVIELSKLGTELTWDDLKGYKGTDIGSGLYVVQFDIDQEFYLLVGDGKTNGKPMYATLNVRNSIASCDIREQDVESFIREIKRDHNTVLLIGGQHGFSLYSENL